MTLPTLYDNTGGPVSLYDQDGALVSGPPAGGDPAPAGVTAILPPAMDATVETMRPEGVRRVTAYAEVGAGKDYATPGEAFTALAGERDNHRIAEGRSALGPDDWITIVVHAGDYEVGTNGLAVPRFSSMYLLDGAHVHGGWRTRPSGDTSAWGAAGTLHGGGICHIELQAGASIVMEAKDEATHIPPKYALHMQQGDYGTMTFVLEPGSEVRQDAMSQGTVCGFDGGKGSTVIFYGGGTLNRTGATAATDITHIRMAGTQAAPATLAYVGGIQSAATLSAHPYKDTEGFPDVRYGDVWIGPGSWPGLVKDQGEMVTHIDPAHSGTVTVGTGAKDARTDWPVPTGGLSQQSWASYYGA